MRDTVLWRRLLAEFLGSALLAAIVIGSGIAAQTLSPGNVGLQLFENAAATATGLFAIILMFGPISGAHFNPVVSFVDAAFGGLKWRDAAAYLPFQTVGCIGGAILANVMFSQAAISISTKHRASGPHWVSEVVATIGLHPGDLRARPIRAIPLGPGGRRCLHRRGVLLHQLDQLRQPGHHRRPHVLQHVCRYRPLVGRRASSPPRSSAASWPSDWSEVSIRASPRPKRPTSSNRTCGPKATSRPAESETSTSQAQLPPPFERNTFVHLIAIGGSDAGISAALRARELDPSVEVTVVVADAYPNFSICGIPYYVSGEVSHWHNLAHRTYADLEATGMQLKVDTLAKQINVEDRTLLVTDASGADELLAYDELVVGTGAVSQVPPIEGVSGDDALGWDDGVHLLHSMGDTFAIMRTLEEAEPSSAVIVGAGYIGLEMAEGLTARGLKVTQMERLDEVLPTVDPELGALVHRQLSDHGVEVLTGTTVHRVSRNPRGVEPPARRGVGRRWTRAAGSGHGPRRRRGPTGHRAGRRCRGQAGHRRRHRGRPPHADQPAARLRRG